MNSAKEIEPSLVVSDEAFEYLRQQKGRLDSIADNRARWLAAYVQAVWNDYEEMRPHLPQRCWGLLDIGSGLGGIDVLLSRHYGGEPFLSLLDGADDPPEMKLHRQTFSSERVARAFLKANKVRTDRIRYHTPTATTEDLCAPYDLVLSLGSWCFHYEPNEYLPRLCAGGGIGMGARLIVDVRKGKPEWSEQLMRAGMRAIAIVRDTAKYQRVVFERAWTPSL